MNYTTANTAIVNKLIKAFGYDGAKHRITETLRVQRINGNTAMIATWEANLNALLASK